MRFQPLFFLLFILGLTSCVVAPQGYYYHPTTEETAVKYEGQWCGGVAGPPAVLKFLLADDCTVGCQLTEGKKKNLRLDLDVEVAPGSRARFLSNEIALTNLETGKRRLLVGDELFLFRYSTPPPRYTPLRPGEFFDFNSCGATEAAYIPSVHVEANFKIDNYYPRAVNILLPPIVTETQTFQIPAIRMQENATAKEAKLREEEGDTRYWSWPYDVVDREDDDTWLTVGEFRIEGYISAGHLVPKDAFGGTIRVHFPPEQKWRFSSDAFSVVDLDSGREYQARFSHTILNTLMTTVFNAPILGKEPLRTKASADFDINETSSEGFMIELPELLLNGKKVRLKPVIFKKRLGVGMVPFNC
ncbi:MAG: hypothetical protein C0622_07960 [Desulfuromonas sp.]|nr:MAG: hypothetical protein C0622_07960 [Desulfuromonas sp.]